MTARRPAAWLTTADPLFDPQNGLFVNGYAFVPLAALRAREKAAIDAVLNSARVDGNDSPVDYGDAEALARVALAAALDGYAPFDPAAIAPDGPRVLVERPGSRRYVAPPRPAFAAGYPKGPCNVRVEGDEFVCASCARRWGRDEARPECPNDKGK